MSTENHKPAEVNLILQGKGGVGKSFIASILAQYYLEKNALYTTKIDNSLK